MQIKVASNVPELGDHLNDEALVKIEREFSRLAGERKQAPADFARDVYASQIGLFRMAALIPGLIEEIRRLRKKHAAGQ